MSNKEAYIVFCEQIPSLPLFLQPWWLDAVTQTDGKIWDVLLAKDENGMTVGAMPYLLRERFGFKYILLPQMTQIGGIVVSPGVEGDKRKIATICRQIKEQLDGMGLAYYHQQFIPGSACVEAMCTLGFTTQAKVTYRVEDLSDIDAVIASFSKNKRRQLHKAKSLHIERGMDVNEFYRLHTEWLASRKRKIRYSNEFLAALEGKARQLQQCEILSVHNADGEPYAAVFLSWDKRYMYYLIPTYNPMYADSGAGALLVLEAMKLAREKHVQFDFEGSMDKGIANHYKQFGSIATTYYAVEKYYNSFFRVAFRIQELREWVSALKCKV